MKTFFSQAVDITQTNIETKIKIVKLRSPPNLKIVIDLTPKNPSPNLKAPSKVTRLTTALSAKQPKLTNLVANAPPVIITDSPHRDPQAPASRLHPINHVPPRPPLPDPCTPVQQ